MGQTLLLQGDTFLCCEGPLQDAAQAANCVLQLLEIFVAGSLAANLSALTFRSKRRDKPLLPLLCAWPLQQLLLQKDSRSGGMSFGWRLWCPVAFGAFASAVARALCAVGTVARIALIWHQSCTEMDYLLLVGSMEQAADYLFPKGWPEVISSPVA